MSREEIKILATKTQNDIQQLLALVESERSRLRGIFNQEMSSLKKEHDKLIAELSKLNDEQADARRRICQKYGHVYQSTVSNKKVFTHRLGYVVKADVTQKCICCGQVRHLTMTPAPEDGETAQMPSGMQEAINEQISAIDEKIKACISNLAETERKIDEVQQRYSDEICKIYGHSHTLNQSGKSICPCCGKEIDENETSFMEFLSKLVNL